MNAGQSIGRDQEATEKYFWVPKGLVWIFALGGAVVLLETAGHLAGHRHGLFPIASVMSFVLAAVIAAVLGTELIEQSLSEIRLLSPGRHTLMALSIAGALAYSVATIARFWRSDIAAGVYLDVVAVLLIATYFGNRALARTVQNSVEWRRRIARSVPPLAHRVDGDEMRDVPPSSLKTGEVVLVPPGEGFPADGVVLEGSSAVDEGIVTGEWVPVVRTVGDKVVAGTRNTQADLLVRVHARPQDELGIEKTDAAQSFATGEPLDTKVPRWLLFSAGILILASAGWWGVVRGDWLFAAHAALSVMIVACPCAYVLARPLALHRAYAVAAERGVLVQSADAFASLSKVSAIVFDKTGTLTKGFPIVAGCHNFDFATDDRVLAMAASAERGSEHPMARAIVEAARRKGLDLETSLETRTLPGEGVSATLAHGPEIFVGNTRLMERLGAYFPARQTIERIEAEFEGKSLVWVARRTSHFIEPLGMIAFRDEPKPEAAALLRILRNQLGVALWIVSGDHERAVQFASRDLPIPHTNVFGGATPEAKAELVERLRNEGHVVAFVGDGENDSLALGRANVGIALGCGAMATRRSADIALLTADLEVLPDLFAIARTFDHRLLWNSAASISLYVLLLPLAAAGQLTPVTAMLAMIASTAMLFASHQRPFLIRAASTPSSDRRDLHAA